MAHLLEGNRDDQQELLSPLYGMRHYLPVHGLADKLDEPGSEGRTAHPDLLSQLLKGPGLIRSFVDQLKRLPGT